MIFRSVAVAIAGITCANAQICGTCAGGTCGVPQPTCGTALPAVQTCGAPPPTCGQPSCQPEPRPDIKIPDPIKGEVFEITRVEKRPMDVIIEKVTIKPETKMVPCHTKWMKYAKPVCKEPFKWDDTTMTCSDPDFIRNHKLEIVKKVDWEVHLVKHEVEFVVPQRVIKNVEWSSARPYYRREIIINMKPVIVNAKTTIRVKTGPPAPDPPPPPRPADQCSSTAAVTSPVVQQPVIAPQPVVQQPVVQPIMTTQQVVQQPVVTQMQAPVVQGGYGGAYGYGGAVGGAVGVGTVGVGTAGVGTVGVGTVGGGAVGGTVIQGGGAATCGTTMYR